MFKINLADLKTVLQTRHHGIRCFAYGDAFGHMGFKVMRIQ